MGAHFQPDTVNVDGLEKMLKALKQKPPKARIGILSDKDTRTGDGPIDNAELGMVHEFGSLKQGLPQRSFLRVPLNDRLGKEMEKEGALSEAEFKEVLKTGTVTPWLKKVAILAEGIVLGAFDSAGYGKWPKWKDPGYTNNAGQILVDTGQLRNSITSEVKENG